MSATSMTQHEIDKRMQERFDADAKKFGKHLTVRIASNEGAIVTLWHNEATKLMNGICQ